MHHQDEEQKIDLEVSHREAWTKLKLSIRDVLPECQAVALFEKLAQIETTSLSSALEACDRNTSQSSIGGKTTSSRVALPE